MPWIAFGLMVRELPRNGEVVVGSGADADWRISTADLMPRHFVVSSRPGSAGVRASTRDTMVVLNRMQVVVELIPLNDGDVILAGNGRFVFTESEPVPAEAAVEAPVIGYLVEDERHVAHPLTSRSTPIGRDSSNPIIVRDPTASRFHAEVRREAGGFALHSMGAAGTLLNGKVMRRPLMLAEGDIVEVAFLKLRFTSNAPSEPVAVPEPPSRRNDEAARRATIAGMRAIPEEPPPVTKPNRRIPWLVALAVLVAASVWWLIS